MQLLLDFMADRRNPDTTTHLQYKIQGWVLEQPAECLRSGSRGPRWVTGADCQSNPEPIHAALLCSECWGGTLAASMHVWNGDVI